MPSLKRSAPRVYELTLRLSDVDPPVWRRMRMSSGATLGRAARVFAIAMQWNPSRPYAFTTGGLRYEGVFHPVGRDERNGTAGSDEGREVRLRQLLPDAGSELEFEYGDGFPWHLVVVLERLLPPNDSLRTPYCLGGAGGTPPLDVGGPWAYEEWRAESATDSGAHPIVAGSDVSAFRRVPVRFNPDVVNAELAQITESRQRSRRRA